jgi:hypothetical protein
MDELLPSKQSRRSKEKLHTAESIERMRTEGFRPALVVETSPGNFQAWLKHSRRLSKELSTVAARALAQEFKGDLGAADWRHFGL